MSNYEYGRYAFLTPGTYLGLLKMEIDIYSHLQTLSKDVFIRADYAFSALETIFFLFNGLYKCTF